MRRTSTAVVTLLLVLSARTTFAVVRVQIADAEGAPGDDVLITVTLTADAGEAVVAIENEIVFDPIEAAVRIGTDGRPDCTVNAAIDKEASRFGFLPFACDATQSQCNVVRAVVVSIVNVTPIPSGSLLYTCRVHLSGEALGTYPLENTNILYAPPDGRDLQATGVSGRITVHGAATATATPSPIPSATNMPTPPATATPLMGDANCDAALTEADITATVAAFFADNTTGCDPDCNGDHRVTAGDVGCVVIAVGSSHER